MEKSGRIKLSVFGSQLGSSDNTNIFGKIQFISFTHKNVFCIIINRADILLSSRETMAFLPNCFFAMSHNRKLSLQSSKGISWRKLQLQSNCFMIMPLNTPNQTKTSTRRAQRKKQAPRKPNHLCLLVALNHREIDKEQLVPQDSDVTQGHCDIPVLSLNASSGSHSPEQHPSFSPADITAHSLQG